MATAYIETLKAKNAEGAETYIYPRTSTSAVVDNNGKQLSSVITDLQTHIHGVVYSTSIPSTIESGTVVFVYDNGQ